MPSPKPRLLIAMLGLVAASTLASAQDGRPNDRAMTPSRHPSATQRETSSDKPSSNAPFENQLKKFSAPLSANGAK